jgi:hypothetical protein
MLAMESIAYARLKKLGRAKGEKGGIDMGKYLLAPFSSIDFFTRDNGFKVLKVLLDRHAISICNSMLQSSSQRRNESGYVPWDASIIKFTSPRQFNSFSPPSLSLSLSLSLPFP